MRGLSQLCQQSIRTGSSEWMPAGRTAARGGGGSPAPAQTVCPWLLDKASFSRETGSSSECRWTPLYSKEAFHWAFPEGVGVAQCCLSSLAK